MHRQGWGRFGHHQCRITGVTPADQQSPQPQPGPCPGLGYSSDVGNSPFGIGWRLTTNAITLRTIKGVPKYEGNDQVVGPGGDVWMPEKSDDGQIISRVVSEYNTAKNLGKHRVVRYWPRVEGGFDLIELWTRVFDPDEEEDAPSKSDYNPAGFWLIHGADGSLHCYGKTEASRRADPE